MSTNVTIEGVDLQGGESSLPVEEQKRPNYEDNTNSWAAIQFRHSASADLKPSRYSNLGSFLTQNIKASQGTVFQAWGTNNSAQDLYLQFHNTAGVPAGGAVPALVSPLIFAGASFDFDIMFGKNGQVGTNGWAMVWSTTAGTYTAAAAAGDQILQVNYI